MALRDDNLASYLRDEGNEFLRTHFNIPEVIGEVLGLDGDTVLYEVQDARALRTIETPSN